MRFLFNLFSVCTALCLATLCHADRLPAVPGNYIVDQANIIDAGTEGQLNSILRQLEMQSTIQFVVLTVQSLDGEPVESFSLATAEKWKIGQKEKDNGLLLVIAMQERTYRFEVGYGLEAVLPDSTVGTIGRTTLVPYFRKGEFTNGIAASVRAVLDVLTASNEIVISEKQNLPAPVQQEKKSQASDLLILLVFIAIVIIIARQNRKRGGRGTGVGPIIYTSGWSGGGGFGGGFGSGGFSGGGGGFGGGGASGSW